MQILTQPETQNQERRGRYKGGEPAKNDLLMKFGELGVLWGRAETGGVRKKKRGFTAASNEKGLRESLESDHVNQKGKVRENSGERSTGVALSMGKKKVKRKVYMVEEL